MTTEKREENQWRVFFDVEGVKEDTNLSYLGTVEAVSHQEAVQAAIAAYEVEEPDKLIVVQ